MERIPTVSTFGPLGDVPGVFCCVVLIDDRPIDRTLLDPAGHPVKRGSVLPDDPRRPKWRTPVPGSLICRISASAPVSGNTGSFVTGRGRSAFEASAMDPGD